MDAARLIDLTRLDKKATAGPGFVLDGPRRAELVTGVPQDVVAGCLAEMPREA